MECALQEALVRAVDLSPWIALSICSLLTVVLRSSQLVAAWTRLSRNRRQARWEHLLVFGKLTDAQREDIRLLLRALRPDQSAGEEAPPGTT